MPIISVVIPAYNAEKTIRETLASILNQTFSDFEVVIINDGSTDSTLDVISSVADPRIVVFSYANSGPQKSRNRGIAKASGEYVSFIDADDLWTPNKLEAQLRVLQANPEVAVVYSWTNYIDERGKLLRHGPQHTFTGDIYANLLLADFIGSGSNPLIRKSALIETGGFDEAILGGQDWDMWLRLAARYPYGVVPAADVLYRKSSNSWSTNIERQEKGFQQVIAKALAQASDSIQSIKRDIFANRYIGLTFDVMHGNPGRKQGLLGARFLWQAISRRPSLLRQKVVWKILLKIAIAVLLPANQSALFTKLQQRLYHVDSLLFYLKLEP